MKYISSVFTQASGSIAGTVYSRNKNGNYTRNRSIPINRNTEAQKAVRAKFAQASSVWSQMDAVARQSFQDQVANYPYVDKLGQTKTYTARQLCAMLNGNLVQSFGQIITTCKPPAPNVPVSNALVENSKSGATITITEFESNVGDGSIPANWQLNVFATAVAPGVGKAWKKSDMRLITSVAAGTPTLPLDITTAYQAVFGDSWQQVATGGGCIGFGFTLVNQITGQKNTSMYLTTSVISA